MSDEKTFDLGTVLSVTTERMLATCSQLYKILNWMTGDDIFTHQLPRVALECAPFILKQHPVLNEVETPDECDDWEAWLAVQRKKYGDEFAIKPLPKGAHEFKDPITELQEIAPGKPIIPVIVG